MPKLMLNALDKNLYREAFESAMQNTPFDGMFHRLMSAMEVNWYYKPDDLRDRARNLFEYLMGESFDNCKGESSAVSSSCIKIEISRYHSNVQCRIIFDPYVNGLGMIYYNEQ